MIDELGLQSLRTSNAQHEYHEILKPFRIQNKAFCLSSSVRFHEQLKEFGRVPHGV